MINLKQDVWYVVLREDIIYKPQGYGIELRVNKTIQPPHKARTLGALYRDEGQARRAAGLNGTVAKVEVKVVETYRYVPESREVIKNV